MRTDLDEIKTARKELERDWQLSVFIVRDLQVTKDAELDDLAWCYHKYGCVRSEAKELLDKLEATLSIAETVDNSEADSEK